MKRSSFSILVAEDNHDDFFLLQRAFQRNGILNPIHWVQDGIEAMEYLTGKGPFANRAEHPLPKVLVIDLKMPRLGGLDLLQWIRKHSELSLLPVLVMSSSNLAEDVLQSYASGANSFFMKPGSFEDLTRLTRTIHDYWVECVYPEFTNGSSRTV